MDSCLSNIPDSIAELPPLPKGPPWGGWLRPTVATRASTDRKASNRRIRMSGLQQTKVRALLLLCHGLLRKTTPFLAQSDCRMQNADCRLQIADCRIENSAICNLQSAICILHSAIALREEGGCLTQ